MREEKMIVFEPQYCSGCMFCMTACSTYNNGATSLSKSRIHVVRHEGHAISKIEEKDDLIFDVIICRQCEEPYCLYLCPSLAIYKDTETAALIIDHSKCVGCRMCMVSCPFGMIFYDSKRRQMMKCELCHGDPVCVKFCPTGALQFQPKNLAHLQTINRIEKRLIQSRLKFVDERSI